VQQSVRIPNRRRARLSFYLHLGGAAPDAALTVYLDSAYVFAVAAGAPGYAQYRRVVVDLSSYADGAPHLLAFEASDYNDDAYRFDGEVDDVALEVPPPCDSRNPTQVGTARADTLSGTPGVDVQLGLDGADLLLGRGNDDRLCGGRGADELRGGSGRDRLFGKEGRDVLRGGPGADTLVGGAGDDLLIGGPGDDRCIGGDGHDTQREC
jgi:hypothetical protein